MAVPMADSPDRLQVVETARKLILSEGAKFSLTSIYRELNCSRSHIRRYFPTKDSLISAAFGRDSGDGIAKPATVAAADKTPPTSMSTTDDWIMRRFRVFERAIATLEGNIDGVRQENAKSVAELEKRIFKSQPSSLSSPLETGRSPHIERESGPANASIVDSVLKREPGFFKEFNSADGLSGVKPPPVVHDGERNTAYDLAEDETLEDGKIHFTTVAADESPDRREWKGLIIFGLTAFSAALLLAIIVIAFTNGAGASYLPDNEIRKPAAQSPKAIGAQKAGFTIGNSGSESQIVINSATSMNPPSRPASLAAKDLGLEDFAAGHVTLNEAGSLTPEAKVKLALAYVRGNGVRADPMMGAFWSGAAAQQGNAEAQYILGTLYAKGIKPDAEQAFHWFSSAAVLGNPKAMHNLAIAFLNGDGVAKDKASAVNWLVRAANLGYRDSAFDLGVLYERGEGVAQNSRTALSWYDNAAGMGDQEAAKRAALLRSDGLEASNRN
jgi:AcrR family transcriptional regulator